jgi:hypothetical protein
MRCAIALTKQHTITTSVLSWGFTSDPAHWLETEIERKKSYNTRPQSSADQPAAQSMSNVRQRTSQFMSVNHLIVRVQRNYTASFVLRLMKKDKSVKVRTILCNKAFNLSFN